MVYNITYNINIAGFNKKRKPHPDMYSAVKGREVRVNTMFTPGMNPTTALRLTKAQHKQMVREANRAKVVMLAGTHQIGIWRLIACRIGDLLIITGTNLRKIGAQPHNIGVDSRCMHPEEALR
jgi:hypothetical protein